MAEQNQNKKDNRGYLYPNNKTKPTHPDYTGTVLIDGKEWRLAAWQNKTSEGKEYLSLTVSPPLTPEQIKKNEEQKNNHNGQNSNSGTPAASNNEESYYSNSQKNEQSFDDLNDDLNAILNSSDDDNPFDIDK